MRPSCTSSGSIPRGSMCLDERDWISTTALPSKKSWLSLRSIGLRPVHAALLVIAASCGNLARAVQPWTIDAILNIPALADPQIRPDGQRFAYVRHSLNGKVGRNVILVAPIPSGAVQEIGTGIHPRWSADSHRLAWLHGQVYVDGSAVTHSPTPPLTYAR